jgi:4-amino-4-deoxy-L-arabinose transferase-like glycosyltransferase
MFATLLAYLRARPRLGVCLWSTVVSAAVFVVAPESLKTTVATDFEPQIQNLLAGRGYTYPDGSVEARVPPIYPTALAAIRAGAKALHVDESLLLFVFAATCLALASVGVFNLASLVIGRGRAWMAAALFAAHPHMLLGVLWPLSETSFAMTLTWSVWIFLAALSGSSHRSRLLGLAGLLTGLALLIRPTALFIPLIMVGWLMLADRASLVRRVGGSALVAAGVCLAVLPWELYVCRHQGTVVPVSSNAVSTIRDGFAFWKARRSPIWMPDAAGRVVEHVQEEYETLIDYQSLTRLMAQELRDNPVGVVQLYLYKMARSWYGVDSQQPRKELFNAVVSVFYMIPVVWGVARYWRRPRDHGHAGLLLLLLVGYFWGMTTLTVSMARYMVPTIAFTVVFIPLVLSDDRLPVRSVMRREAASGAIA